MYSQAVTKKNYTKISLNNNGSQFAFQISNMHHIIYKVIFSFYMHQIIISHLLTCYFWNTLVWRACMLALFLLYTFGKICTILCGTYQVKHTLGDCTLKYKLSEVGATYLWSQYYCKYSLLYTAVTQFRIIGKQIVTNGLHQAHSYNLSADIWSANLHGGACHFAVCLFPRSS